MEIVYEDIKECCGCGACEKICMQGAISMKNGEQGFLYPEIDSEKCNDCGLCRKKCPSINEELNNLLRIGCEKPVTYAAYVKDNILDSTSGGIATAISQKIIECGGIVYGAEWSEDFRMVYHKKATTIEGLNSFKTSKYVQSDKRYVYKSVQSDLKNDVLVLFIGLPCEIAGLSSFLGTDHEKLLTISLICHGVASYKYLDVVLDDIEKKNRAKVSKLNMRYKEGGKTSYSVKIFFDDQKEIILPEHGFYFHAAFLDNYIIRPSCGDCKFKGLPQFSDITLGDYWGLSESHPGHNKAGVSAVLINTPKGDSFFNSISEKIISYKGDLESLVRVNKRLITSVPNLKTVKFLKLEKKYGVLGALKKVAINKAWRARYIKLKRLVKFILKPILDRR